MHHQALYSRYAAGEVQITEGLVYQLKEKLRLIKRIVGSNPLIPLLSFIGFVWCLDRLEGRLEILIYLYFLGILLKLGVSFLPMWWYQVPLLPVIAFLGGLGALELGGKGIPGVLLLICFAGGWLFLNVFKISRLSYEELNRRAWKMHPEMGDLHLEMQRISGEIEEMVNGGSLFVYGLPSPNAMVGRSYDVNFLTAAYYLDEMNPNWNIELHTKILEDPPSHIISMLHGFNARAVEENLGLKYESVKTWPGKLWNCQLYKHTNKVPIDRPNYSFQSLII
jgi:hypothetical protein